MASCIVLVILVRFPANSEQLPYDYATFCIWGAVEVDIAVVSGKKLPFLDGPETSRNLHTCQVAVLCCDRLSGRYARVYSPAPGRQPELPLGQKARYDWLRSYRPRKRKRMTTVVPHVTLQILTSHCRRVTVTICW